MREGRRKGKGSRHRGRTPKPILGINVHIGNEEKNGKHKKEKERNWERVPNPATQEHSFASYDMQGSYSEPILLTSPAHRGKDIYIYFIKQSPHAMK